MTLSMSERGRLGGLACYRKHGAQHMAEIGRAGFRALARRLCTRRGAVGLILRKARPGFVDLHPPTMTPEQEDRFVTDLVDAACAAAEVEDIPF